jgi:simple sugar transport system ATP-binding protein
VLLDEPTAALGVAETKKVEELVIRLKNRGAAVLLVSHNMDQVFRLADRVAVLRRGKQVGVRDTNSMTRNELVGMITGVADE